MAVAKIVVTTSTGYVLHAVAVCEDGFDLDVELRCPPHRVPRAKSSHVMHLARVSIPRRAVGGKFTDGGLHAARALLLRLWSGR